MVGKRIADHRATNRGSERYTSGRLPNSKTMVEVCQLWIHVWCVDRQLHWSMYCDHLVKIQDLLLCYVLDMFLVRKVVGMLWGASQSKKRPNEIWLGQTGGESGAWAT